MSRKPLPGFPNSSRTRRGNHPQSTVTSHNDSERSWQTHGNPKHATQTPSSNFTPGVGNQRTNIHPTARNQTGTGNQYQSSTIGKHKDPFRALMPQNKPTARSQEQRISRWISDILENLGVSREIIRAKQTLWLQMENLWTVFGNLEGKTMTILTVGSQFEGSSTPGITSNIDHVVSYENIHVIADVINSVSGREEYLVHYLNTTPPGYCVLRPLKEDVGIPVKDIEERKQNEQTMANGVVCLIHGRLFPKGHDEEQMGHVIQKYDEEYDVTDNIIRCFRLPLIPKGLLNDWSARTMGKSWPSVETRERILQGDCYLEPVGHGESSSPEVEFRFLFVSAERMLMMDMNLVQTRCLTLMKLLNHTFFTSNRMINTKLPTYLFKTALWYAIEDTEESDLTHDNVLLLTNRCLKWIHDGFAKHVLTDYFLPAANLLEGRFDHDSLTEITRLLAKIINNPQNAFSRIVVDEFGERFQQRMYHETRGSLKPSGSIHFEIMNHCVTYHMFKFLKKFNQIISANLRQYDLEHNISMIKTSIGHLKQNKTSNNHVQFEKVVQLIVPLLHTILGCLIGAQNTNRSLRKALEAEQWLKTGKDSDLASGRLKLASAYYSYGEYKRADEVLQELEDEYLPEYVLRVCGCRQNERVPISKGFYDGAINGIDEATLHESCAYCVVFTRSEKPCAPPHFQNEMYRGSDKEVKRRNAEDYWMNWACVDALPYLHFLRYLTLDALHDRKQSVASFRVLEQLSKQEIWYHSETVYNLLGQCYEKEGCEKKAHACYNRSVEIMSGNNAANRLKRRLRAKRT